MNIRKNDSVPACSVAKTERRLELGKCSWVGSSWKSLFPPRCGARTVSSMLDGREKGHSEGEVVWKSEAGISTMQKD